MSEEVDLIAQGRYIVRSLWDRGDRGITPEDLIGLARSYLDATVVTDHFFLQSVNQRRGTSRKPL
ncbi:hypothetical protein N9K16_03955 [Alphaproteobacteria bacterium]|nr:hypothetical protein [Alphaproteobacteria bacterium]